MKYEYCNIIARKRMNDDYEIHFAIDDVLNEEENIQNDTDVVVDVIFAEVIKKWINYSQIFTYEINSEYIYTGFNFIPDVLKEWRKQNPDKKLRGKRPSVVWKCDNENIYFPIYYKLIDSDENEIGASISRKFYVDEYGKYIGVDITNKKVLIELNIKFICNTIMNDISVNRLKNTISHELQHSFDSYIISDKDFSMFNRNSIYYDFRNENWYQRYFGKNVIKDVAVLLYLINPNECHARHKALNTCLEIIADNGEMKNNLQSQAYEFYKKNINKTFDKFYLKRRHLNSLILKTSLVREETLLRKCYELVYELLSRQNEKLIILLGYFMNKHKMIHYKRESFSNVEVREFFRRDNVERYLDDKIGYNDKEFEMIYPMIELTKRNLENVYLDYERTIYNECDKWLDKIFNFKMMKTYSLYNDFEEHKKQIDYVKLEMSEM